jgi:hypothetical protein
MIAAHVRVIAFRRRLPASAREHIGLVVLGYQAIAVLAFIVDLARVFLVVAETVEHEYLLVAAEWTGDEIAALVAALILATDN